MKDWAKDFKHKYAKNAFIYNCILFSLLFLIHCFWGNAMYIVFPIVFVCIALSSLKNGLSYIFFCIPFCMLNMYMSVILFFACILLYVLKFYFVVYIKEKNKPNILLIIVISIFLIYCALPIADYNINTLIKVAIFFFIFAVLGMLIKKPDVLRLKFNITTLAISLIIASIFSATYFISPYLQGYLDFAYATNTLARFESLVNHANVLAMMCEVILGIMTYYIISRQAKLRDYFIFVIIAGIGLATFSKTYLLMLMFILFCIFVWQLSRNFIKTTIISSIVGALIIIVLVLKMDFTMIFINRFFKGFADCNSFMDFMNIITTYRYNLWIQYLVYLSANPLVILFGRGLGAPVLSTLSAHNFFISAIYQLGIVGSILFILVVALMIREFRKNKTTKIHKAICVPIIIITLLLFVEDVIFYIF